MKKLLIFAIVASGLIFSNQTFAQERALTAAETTKEKVQEEFTRIEVNQLPQEVREAVSRDFKEARIAEAAISKDRIYKLVLVSDSERKTVYADARGNWVNKK